MKGKQRLIKQFLLEIAHNLEENRQIHKHKKLQPSVINDKVMGWAQSQGSSRKDN